MKVTTIANVALDYERLEYRFSKENGLYPSSSSCRTSTTLKLGWNRQTNPIEKLTPHVDDDDDDACAQSSPQNVLKAQAPGVVFDLAAASFFFYNDTSETRVEKQNGFHGNRIEPTDSRVAFIATFFFLFRSSDFTFTLHGACVDGTEENPTTTKKTRLFCR